MPLEKTEAALARNIDTLRKEGRLKGKEIVITAVKKPEGEKGPRFLVEGYGDKEFIKMNSNSYLGMALNPEVIEAEEKAAQEFGVGPGAVRFISGTHTPHIELEDALARFHGKEAGMIFSSAYACVVGTISPLITKETIVISDELNHNSIINAIRVSRPKDKKIYPHNDMSGLETAIKGVVGQCKRLMIVTDGIFSMRGDHAPLDEIVELAKKYDSEFEEGVFTVVDDSHGVGAFGETGRGTIEFTGNADIDILIGTLGKAIGVNGGYLVSSAGVIECLRETAPMYIYSNPITPSEACAAKRSLEILDSETGKGILAHMREMSAHFRKGLVDLGYEIIEGHHPVVPLMVRDTAKTKELVNYLKENGILATGLAFPVVPRGDEEIRFQVCANLTRCDIDSVLKVLEEYKNK